MNPLYAAIAQKYPQEGLPSFDEVSAYGPYTVKAQLSQGGQSVTSLALDGLGRIVVDKRHHNYINQSVIGPQRFAEHMAIVQSIVHPNVSHTLDGYIETESLEIGEPREFPHTIIAYVPGDSLDDMMRRGPVDEELVRRIVTQIASGTLEVHRRGLIHRDIKPANIIVTPDLDSVLLDAHAAVRKQDGLRAYDSKFTLVSDQLYRDPQCTVGAEDYSSDVHSLGLTALNALRGEHVLPYIHDKESFRLSHVSPGFVRVLRQACSSDITVRPQHMEALLEQLAYVETKTPTALVVARAPKAATPITEEKAQATLVKVNQANLAALPERFVASVIEVKNKLRENDFEYISSLISRPGYTLIRHDQKYAAAVIELDNVRQFQPHAYETARAVLHDTYERSRVETKKHIREVEAIAAWQVTGPIAPKLEDRLHATPSRMTVGDFDRLVGRFKQDFPVLQHVRQSWDSSFDEISPYFGIRPKTFLSMTGVYFGMAEAAIAANHFPVLLPANIILAAGSALAATLISQFPLSRFLPLREIKSRTIIEEAKIIDNNMKEFLAWEGNNPF